MYLNFLEPKESATMCLCFHGRLALGSTFCLVYSFPKSSKLNLGAGTECQWVGVFMEA